MNKYLFLNLFTSALTLSLWFLSQPVLCMEREDQYEKQISSRKPRIINLGEKLSFKSDEADICIPETSWINLKPCLEEIVQLTVKDPMCEERKIHFIRFVQDSEDYFEWHDHLRTKLVYPISIGSGNEGAEGTKVEGKYKKYKSYLLITNNTKKEQEVRELPYKKFGGNFKESEINLRTFYNLMARVGFEIEDFAQGKYGYQDKIYVKPVHLKNETLSDCMAEIKKIILSSLENVTQSYVGFPYVAFILELDKDVSYTLEEIDSYGRRKSFFHEIEPLATIIERDENRIYISFMIIIKDYF